MDSPPDTSEFQISLVGLGDERRRETFRFAHQSAKLKADGGALKLNGIVSFAPDARSDLLQRAPDVASSNARSSAVVGRGITPPQGYRPERGSVSGRLMYQLVT